VIYGCANWDGINLGKKKGHRLTNDEEELGYVIVGSFALTITLVTGHFA